jgi:hypothetical protein
MTAAQFVDILHTNSGGALSPSERDQLVADLGSGAKTRAQVLRRVAKDPDFTRAESSRAFVRMEYLGSLRRNPSDATEATLDFPGYNFWLSKLNQFRGDFMSAEMVKAFLTSSEYIERFAR